MHEQQNGKCAICGVSIALVGTKNIKDGAHVDHDHVTGNIRGLLCHNCNAGIGYLREDISLLENAIQYLNKSKGGK